MTPPPVVLGTLVPESFARELASRRHFTPEEAARQRRARMGLVRWWARVAPALGPASSPRAIHEAATAPLLRLLGYVPDEASMLASRDRVESVVRARGRTPLAAITVPWNAPPDTAWRAAVTLGTRAGVAWCVVANGPAIHLVDAARPYARRHVGIDLARAASTDAEFAVLWTLCSADRLVQRDGPTELDAVIEAAARHVALTCSALDRGVRSAFDRLHEAFGSRRPRRAGGHAPPAADQALTVVFRLLFLLYAESRRLLPTDHPIYRDAYAMASLGEDLDTGRPRGLWPALRAIMRMAHDGCRVRGLDVTAFNGRLFSPRQAPLVEDATIDDSTVRAVVGAITTRPAPGGRRAPIPYADLGVEQLGAIYEQLIDAPGEIDACVGRASARKATGTFYTPRPLTEFVVRRTLAPLVAGAAPEAVLALRVVDPAMGSGAFLVAACRYLAAAYEAALVAAGQVRAGDLGDRDRAGFRRLVAQRCLYGVDVNPMAVQLARLSLWLTTLARDQPLSFLDHRLRTGDSLVGARPEDLARQPPGPGRRGRAPSVLPLLAALDPVPAVQASVVERLRMACTPDTSADVVRAKEAALARLDSRDGPLGRWRRAADVWCAGWFWPSAPPPSPGALGDLLADALASSGTLAPAHREALLAEVDRARAARGFFHWPVEFPEVFADENGLPREAAGFDAVLGNPPWDVLRAEHGATRDQVRAMSRFVRESGIYGRSADAHVNRYQLFVERSLDLVGPGGRVGLIVPWGLFSDAGSVAVRRRLLERTAIDTLVAFENRQAIFPIHRSVRFAAFALTAGAGAPAIRCRAGEASVHRLDAIADRGTSDEHFPIVLTRDALRELAGEGLALPAVRTAADLDLLLRLRWLHPSLSDPAGWGMTFGRELNATDDRPDFAPAGPGYPIVEGKHVSPFCVDTRRVTWWLPAEGARGRRPHRFDQPRLGFRDVAGAGNRLTLIAAVVPAGVATTHTLFTARASMSPASQAVLCALVNSLVANWFVRHWVSTHVTTQIVHRLPVPLIHPHDAAFDRLVQLSTACAGEGTEGEAWIALQAEAARAYGIGEGDLARVLAAFPLIDEDRRAAIAAAFTVGARQRPVC